VTSECTFQVRTYECDSYGHVNNAVYLNYLEMARYKFLKDAGFDYPGVVKAGFGVYIARVEIDYKKSAFCDDTLTIKSSPLKRGAVSGVMAQTIFRGEEVISEAKVTWAFVDKKGVPTRIPPQFDVPALSP